MKIWSMRIACWIPEATNTHIGCVIGTAFPLQQWLHERTTVLRYTYIACRVLLLIKLFLSLTHKTELLFSAPISMLT
jgi:hypothetical protein